MGALSMFVLMVTWFYFNQAPQSSQTPFASEQTCQAARAQILGEARRLNADRDAQIVQHPGYNPFPAPTVSAICAKR
jgi:hypothetical protein